MAAGDYQVTVMDVNDCSAELNFSIDDKAPIELAITQDSASCNVADGRIIVGIISNTSSTNFSFAWSDNPNRITNRASNLAKGEYTVTVTDEDGCTALETIALGEEVGIQLNATATPVLCAGAATGTASVVAAGGSGNYVYLWDDPIAQENPTAQNLLPGDYMVLVLDDNGCERTTNVTVPNEAISFTHNFDVKNISCFGRQDGEITTNIFATSDLNFQWSNGVNGTDLTNLSPANYFLTITDANGCESFDSVEITTPDEFFAETMVEPISCPGTEDGQISIIPLGGTAPYQYSLNGRRFAFDGDFLNLTPGVYIPSIMDANGCAFPLEEILLPDAEPLTIEVSNLEVKVGDITEITPQVENGKGELTFIWSGNNLDDLSCLDCLTPTLTATSSQLYKLTVQDEVGCEANANIRVFVERNQNIYVPTGFSPNNDGQNDRLTVHGKEGTSVLSFKIFDRWGELVFVSGGFEVNDESAGWDGQFKGQELSTGVFPWVAEVRFADGVVEIRNGHSNLIR